MAPPHKYKSGDKFNCLTLIEYLPGGMWLCRCECGRVINADAGQVQTNKKKSCGCLRSRLLQERLKNIRSPYYQFTSPEGKPRPKKLIDLTGQTFGALTVESYSGGSWWLCQCKCGQRKEVLAGKLTGGHITSCGCRIHQREKSAEKQLQTAKERKKRQSERYHERKQADPPPPRRVQKKATAEKVLIKKVEKISKESQAAIDLQNLFFKRS